MEIPVRRALQSQRVERGLGQRRSGEEGEREFDLRALTDQAADLDEEAPEAPESEDTDEPRRVAPRLEGESGNQIDVTA